MKNIFSNKLSMYRATYALFVENQSIIDSVPKLKAAQTELDARIQEIMAKTPAQSQRKTGFAESKKEQKELLIDNLLAVGGPLRVLLSEQNKRDVVEQLPAARNDWMRLRVNEFEAKAQLVADTFRANVREMPPFGIGEADLTQLAAVLTDYLAVAPKVRQTITNRTILGTEIEENVGKIDLLFDEMIDYLMEPFRLKNAAFFNRYAENRTVLNRGIRHRKDESDTTKFQSPNRDNQERTPLAPPTEISAEHKSSNGHKPQPTR